MLVSSYAIWRTSVIGDLDDFSGSRIVAEEDPRRIYTRVTCLVLELVLNKVCLPFSPLSNLIFSFICIRISTLLVSNNGHLYNCSFLSRWSQITFQRKQWLFFLPFLSSRCFLQRWCERIIIEEEFAFKLIDKKIKWLDQTQGKYIPATLGDV